MSLRVTTTDFKLYNKLSNLNLNNYIVLDNNRANLKRLNKILRNINKSKKNLSIKKDKENIYLIKNNNFKLNVYFR